MNTLTKRSNPIRNKYVTDDIIEDLALDFLTVSENPLDFKVVDVVKYFNRNKTFNLAAVTIARIVRYLLPDSKATAGSVRFQQMKLNQKQDEIDQMIENIIMRGE